MILHIIWLVLALKISLALGAAALVSTITFRVIAGGGKYSPGADTATSKGTRKKEDLKRYEKRVEWCRRFNKRNGWRVPARSQESIYFATQAPRKRRRE